MQWTVRRGSEQTIVRFLAEPGGGDPISGLADRTEAIDASYLRESDRGAQPFPLLAIPSGEGEHHPGLLRELDPDGVPGLYELHVPDRALAEGRETLVLLRLPDRRTLSLRFDLVGYDPQDGERLGLDALSREGRHAVITRAFREVVPAIIREFQEADRKAEE